LKEWETFRSTCEGYGFEGGAALVIAGLVAEGVTEVYNIRYIDRGYENIEGKLSKLGAQIVRNNGRVNGWEITND